MTIATRDALLAALPDGVLLNVNKASIANQTAGGFASYWRSTGFPLQGATPSTAAVCDRSLTGALVPWSDPSAPTRTYVSNVRINNPNVGGEVLIHDRLAHMGGLSGTVTTAQTVDVDVSGSTNNLANRRGATDYSDVRWWLEWYTDTGSSAVTATVAVTYDDGSTANLSVSLSATMRASRMLSVVPATAGRYIKSVQSVTLSGTTGTAGSFGVTATRLLGSLAMPVANTAAVGDWTTLGLPRVHDSACLFFILVPTAAASGALVGSVKLVQG